MKKFVQPKKLEFFGGFPGFRPVRAGNRVPANRGLAEILGIAKKREMAFPKKCREDASISSSKSHGENTRMETDREAAVMTCCTSRPMDWIMPSRSVACTRARSSRS